MVIFCISYAGSCTFKYLDSYCIKHKAFCENAKDRYNIRHPFHSLYSLVMFCVLFEFIYSS